MSAVLSAAEWTPKGRLGVADRRASTVSAMMVLVDRLLPRALLIENVVGFVQGETSARAAIESAFQEINRRHKTRYRMTWRVVNAADYGVAQERRRAIGIALREDAELASPYSIDSSARIVAWDAIGDLPTPDSSQYPPLGRWGRLLPAIPEGENYQWLTSRGGGPEIFGYRTRYWTFLLKLAKRRPSWTISASPGPSTGPFHWDNRHLTVRERLRLQSFPDEWSFAGDLRAQIRMAGNATPPLLAEAFGDSIYVRAYGPRP